MTEAAAVATTPSHDAAREDPRARLDRLLRAFEGPVQRPKLPLMYKVALGAVAVAMVILPLVYVALAIGAAWGTIWLNGAILESEITGRALVGAMIAVNVIGWIVVFFMFKPLFAPKSEEAEPFTLDRNDEPVLYGFVDHLCEVVGAPAPKRIDIDCQVNASAGFRRGLVSFFGKDLKLTIGLPLVAGLDLPQFTGVLAHEFGHFSQGAGMRLTYIIRTVSHWFARVVYERDAWDDRLVEWSSGGDGRIMIIVGTARGAVWLTRRVLWLLMMAGHAISCFALRQMEYDADAYETQVAGSDVFETTSLRIPQLGYGSQAAHNHLSQLFNDRRLCDDMPAFIHRQTSRFEPDTLAKIRESTLGQKTGFLDTHPADADRISASRRIDARGVFRFDAPATILFNDFEAISQVATEKYYRAMLGPLVSEARLESVDDLMAGGESERDAGNAMGEVFGETFMPIKPAWPTGDTVGTCDDPQATIEELRFLAETMLAERDAAAASAKAWDTADNHVIAVEEKVGIEACGTGTGSSTFRMRPRSEMGSLGVRLTELEEHRDASSVDYDAFVKRAGRRIDLALSLLRIDTTLADRSDKLEQLLKTDEYLAAMAALREVWPMIDEARSRLVKMSAALTKHNEDPDKHKKMVPPLEAMAASCADHLNLIRDRLTGAYPFDHADTSMTLGKYLVGMPVSRANLSRTFSAANDTLANAFEVVHRLTAYLCGTVRLVERDVLGESDPTPVEPAA